MKYSIFIAAIAFLSLACNRADKSEKSERDKDSLEMVIYQKNHIISEFKNYFTEIESNLDSINRREKVLLLKSESSKEALPNKLEEINAEIKAINSILLSNRKTVSHLNAKLKSTENENSVLQSETTKLNGQLRKKEEELEALREKLKDFGNEIVVLHTVAGYLALTNAELVETVYEETETLHTAYYIAGDRKQLRNFHIIDSEGGLLGAGKTDHLTDAFDKKLFTKIDLYRVSIIPVNSKKVKLVTPHPPYAYKLVLENNQVKDIVIINPEKFWSISKYLVIETIK